MLERLFISYRDMDDESIDINELALEDEKKYNILLTQAFDFDPKGADEEDIIIDYTNTLGKIVSSYSKLKDIKKILATLPGSGLEDEKISAPLITSAKAEIRNIYYRLSDLQILESTNELKNMKKRYEKRTLSTQSKTSAPHLTYHRFPTPQSNSTEVSTEQSILDSKTLSVKKNTSFWDKIASCNKAFIIIAIIALFLSVVFATAYSILGNTMNSAVMHYDASETATTIGCGSIRCKYCEGITIKSTQYRGPYSFPYYSSVSNARMVCELLAVFLGFLSVLGFVAFTAIKIKGKNRSSYNRNKFDIKNFFDKNKGMIIISTLLIVALIIICILASNLNNQESGDYNQSEPTTNSSNNQPSSSKPQLTPVSEPRTGAVLTGAEYYNGSELTIHASGGHSYVVKLKTSSGVTRLSFYVRAGDSVTVNVPNEYLYVYFASGDTWYGEEHLFGEDTSYSMDDDIQNFIDYTWEYTLYPVYNGNFSETPISADQFN